MGLQELKGGAPPADNDRKAAYRRELEVQMREQQQRREIQKLEAKARIVFDFRMIPLRVAVRRGVFVVLLRASAEVCVCVAGAVRVPPQGLDGPPPQAEPAALSPQHVISQACAAAAAAGSLPEPVLAAASRPPTTNPRSAPVISENGSLPCPIIVCLVAFSFSSSQANGGDGCEAAAAAAVPAGAEAAGGGAKGHQGR